MEKINEKLREKIQEELEKAVNFEELSLTFKFYVLKYGEVLLIRNKEEFLIRKRKILSEYLDFQPFKYINDLRWLK